jgi:hypothetical protein
MAMIPMSDRKLTRPRVLIDVADGQFTVEQAIRQAVTPRTPIAVPQEREVMTFRARPSAERRRIVSHVASNSHHRRPKRAERGSAW